MPHSILVIGSNRRESLESSYARAFEAMGWTVRFWDPAHALASVARGQHVGRLFSGFVHVEPWTRKANGELLQVADEMQPTLVLLISTSGVRGGTLAQLKVRAPRTLIYCVYPDSPHNLDADRIHCLPFCDRVTTSSPAWVDAFVKLGARCVHYLPFAADTHLYRPISLSSESTATPHDVAFIGTWRPEREEFLEQLCDLDLCVWGSDYWKRRTRRGSPLAKHWGGKSITGQEFAQVCGGSKILLNVMDSVTWPGPNMRTFELPACGAFALVPRTPAVTNLFREGETVECFEGVEEARDKIGFYLKHDEARQKIAASGHAFVVQSGHTYGNRARQIARWTEEDRA